MLQYISTYFQDYASGLLDMNGHFSPSRSKFPAKFCSEQTNIHAQRTSACQIS